MHTHASHLESVTEHLVKNKYDNILMYSYTHAVCEFIQSRGLEAVQPQRRRRRFTTQKAETAFERVDSVGKTEDMSAWDNGII